MEEARSSVMRGDLKTLIRVSLPIMFFLFFESLSAFVERIFLSYHAMESVQASLNANYLANIFQSPCMAIGAMAQVFVGFYQGSHQSKRIGPCIWQLIWFSLLSLVVTLPLSHVVSSFYFQETMIQVSGAQYFRILSFGNFLYPLCATLSSFYLGRGKTLFVTSLMLASYVCYLGMGWIFIFGVEGWWPSLGAQGAALAKCISVGLVCSVLLTAFLSQKNRIAYGTDLWRLSLGDLWHYVSSGLVRALGYLSSKICWAGICYVMTRKGGFYLDVLTVGGTVTGFLVFIANGMYRAILTVASNLVGSDKRKEFWYLCRSFTIYIAMIGGVLTVPLIFFPQVLIYFFQGESKLLFEMTFQSICYSVWFYTMALTIQMSFCALLVTFKEMKYQLYCYLVVWPAFVLCVYYGIGLQGWPADQLWVIMTCESLLAMFLFWARLYWRTPSLEVSPLKVD